MGFSTAQLKISFSMELSPLPLAVLLTLTVAEMWNRAGFPD